MGAFCAPHPARRRGLGIAKGAVGMSWAHQQAVGNGS